jgi:hypothetical protein
MEAGKNKKSRASAPAKQNLLRAIPQVDEVLQWLSDNTDAPLLLIKQTVREELETLRQNILAGKKIGKLSFIPTWDVPFCLIARAKHLLRPGPVIPTWNSTWTPAREAAGTVLLNSFCVT